MHVSFIRILLPKFLTDILVNIILFGVGRLCARIGALDNSGRDDCWHIWVGEGYQCLVHYGWLPDISVGRPNMPLQLLHNPGELFQGYWPRVKDITL